MKKTTKLDKLALQTKRLSVSTEKVRPLSEQQLEDVNGGLWTNTWCRTCSCWIC